MKKLFFLAVLLISLSVSVNAADKGKQLAIGDKAVLTDVKMKDVSGKEISLNDAKKENKLFDRVWRDGLLLKLKDYNIKRIYNIKTICSCRLKATSADEK